MKLRIHKDQKSGMFSGKAKFFLRVRAEIDSSEQAVIKKYGLENEVLVDPGEDIGVSSSGLRGAALKILKENRITAKRLIDGAEFNCTNVGEILTIEDQIIQASKTLTIYLRTAQQFGGEKIVDIENILLEEKSAMKSN